MRYRVLAIAQYKGGVGKTFTAKALAEYASMIWGLRTLLIDLDPQTNLSRRFLDMELLTDGTEDYAPPLHPDYDPSNPEDADWNGVSSSADIWLKEFAVPYPTAYPNLDILPAHSQDLQMIEQHDQSEIFALVVERLRDYVELPDLKSGYDLVILDTRPSKGPLVKAAIHAATHLLIPTEMEAPSVEGLPAMLGMFRAENRLRGPNAPLAFVGVLPNKIRANVKIHREFLESIKENPLIGPTLLPVSISDWIEYKESMVFGMPSIFTLPESNPRRQQLSEVCETVLGRIYPNR